MSKLGYVWFDSEFSSLELESAVLLQVAALATDEMLRPKACNLPAREISI